MSPARTLANERPSRNRSVPDRTPSRRATDRAVPSKARTKQEIDNLVTEHLPLAQFAVNAVASRISLPSHVSRDDLLSCALVALVEVARRFDPTAGASFATYALARLQGAVLDELRSGDWASRSVRAAARRTDAAADALAMALGRPPTKEELAASLGVARSDLDALQADVHRAIMVSIDADNGGEGTSLDLPDTGDSPERILLNRERARHLEDAIRALPDRLDEVIERNFFSDESLTTIAEDLGVTLSRVSQMRSRALILLHAAMSEVWQGQPVPADGGVRARNQQRQYVDRVAGRGGVRPPEPAPADASSSPPVPTQRAPGRHGWQTPDRFPPTQSTAQSA